MRPRVKAMARKVDYRSNVTPTPVFRARKQVLYLRWQFIRSAEIGETSDYTQVPRRKAR
jgi:hypothetical protein